MFIVGAVAIVGYCAATVAWEFFRASTVAADALDASSEQLEKRSSASKTAEAHRAEEAELLLRAQAALAALNADRVSVGLPRIVTKEDWFREVATTTQEREAIINGVTTPQPWRALK